MHPPLRILSLVASPRRLPPLGCRWEQDCLAEALAEPVADGLMEVVWVPQATRVGVHALRHSSSACETVYSYLVVHNKGGKGVNGRSAAESEFD